MGAMINRFNEFVAEHNAMSNRCNEMNSLDCQASTFKEATSGVNISPFSPRFLGEQFLRMMELGNNFW